MSKKEPKRRRKHKVPLPWILSSVCVLLVLGVAIFAVLFRKLGGTYPLAAGDSTDPYFFSFIFSVSIPLLLYVFVIDKVLKGIASKRAGVEVAKDIAVDIAKAAAVTAAEVVLGGSSSDSRSSSGGGAKGGGGEFGGGGASGGY